MKVKDVSQSTNVYEIAEVIQQLNPDVEIRVANMAYDPEATSKFYSSIPMEGLILPEGFYANEKNGITNKHNTKSGLYCSLRVADLSLADERTLLPKKPKVKDVSQSTNIYEIAEVIQQLNPDAEIRVGNMAYDSEATTRFYSSVPMEYLVLPEGFYANDKNGITNKHNTETGIYCSLRVENLRLADERTLLPKKPKVKDVSQSTNIYEIAEVIQQLNPDAEIRVGNMAYDSEATTRFFSSVPMEDLILPEGFYANDKNGITNKHNTETGIYCSLRVEDLSMADKRTLLPKARKILKIKTPAIIEEIKEVKNVIVETMRRLKEKIVNKGVSLNAKHR